MRFYIMERSKKTLEAATAMKLTSKDLLKLKIIDEIISEPSGGAHRDKDQILLDLKNSIRRNLIEFEKMSRQDIIEHRKNKFLRIGRKEIFQKVHYHQKNYFLKV